MPAMLMVESRMGAKSSAAAIVAGRRIELASECETW